MDKIRFANPDVGLLEKQIIESAIDTHQLTFGDYVRDFETKIAELSCCDKAVCFDSCTAALEMSLRVLGIGPGDEVITTPFTYSATAEVIRNTGAKIVFADLAPNGLEMDYNKVAKLITERTKAIIPVDYGGKLCDYDAIYRVIIAHKNVFHPSSDIQSAIGRIAVVADAAHSFTAQQDGKVCGQFADFTCFSFHAVKVITTGGEGGAVVWKNISGVDNNEIERKFRLLGDHGQTSRTKSKGWEYDIASFGYNHIMTNIDAAMGLGQIARIDELREKRRAVTSRYDLYIQDMCAPYGIKQQILHFGPNYESAMHLYPIFIPSCSLLGDEKRNKMYNILAECGVPCNVHYKPLPMMTAYKNIGFDIKDFPQAYERFRTLLTIPYHTELTEEMQMYIVENIIKAMKMCD